MVWSALTTFVFTSSEDVGTQTLGSTMEAVSGLIFLYVMAAILAILLRSDCPTVGSALGWANKNFASIWWLAIVLFLVQLTGFILLIIPGVIVFGYVLLSYPVRVVEERRGIAAMVRSTASVWGHWWGIVLRMLVYGLTLIPLAFLAILATFFLAMLLGTTNPWVYPWLEIFVWVVTGLMVVLSAKASSVLYQYRAAAVPTYEVEQWSGVVTRYKIMGWLALPLMILPLIILTSLDTASQSAGEALVQQTMASTAMSAQMHYIQNNESYAGFCEAHTFSAELRDRGLVCEDSDEEYRMYIELSGGYLCANTDEMSMRVTQEPPTDSFLCE